MDWFIYDRDLRHERVKLLTILPLKLSLCSDTFSTRGDRFEIFRGNFYAFDEVFYRKIWYSINYGEKNVL